MKPLSPSAACAAKCLFAVMLYMKENCGEVATKEINDIIRKRVDFTDWEEERAGKLQNIRWWSVTQFYSIDYNKAGYILKKQGSWYLTPEGEEAIKLGADQILRNANAAYRKWRQEKDLDADDAVEEETPEKETIVNIERLEEQANDGIRKYIKAKNPYEFQDMVAALLRAMGYYTPFIAPKGRNGGVDVIAYIDALGAKTPRIKVQVKHRPDDCIPAKDIRSLLGILRDGDIALFVTSGTYSQQARTEALTSKTYIKLIDGEEFIQMWQDNYSKMTDDDKNMLPLKHIAFVGSSE
ncbi:MAG: restriction endonuclease [Bacteroidales bacterium]|nr:restriction endonuclease [Bacteroidales bacterium]